MLTRRSALARSAALAGLSLTGLGGAAGAQPARVPVRVGYVPVIGAAPLFVMTGAGWTKEAGLDLVTTKFESGPPAIQALASGTLDVLFVGIAPIAVARARGLPVKVVAASGIGGSGFAVQPNLAAAFAAHGGKAAEAFKAFRAQTGRPAKIGVLPPGSTPTVALRYWLKQQGVQLEDVALASMGIDVVQQAMLTGAIDGGTVLEPSLTLVQTRKPDVKTVAFAPEMYPNLPGVVLSATERFMGEQTDALVTIVRLAARARELILADPAAAAPFIQAVLSGGLVDAEVFARALRSKAVSFAIDPRTIVAATRDSLAFEVEIGDFPTAPPVEGLFDFTIYDKALAG
ncbi:ABC transporter substrate-binding protein [Enterovirga sp.]|uniref:ABC transporter substrate-binding protein n=1 Tax=Enterovirga sp. TaxID=2026350 RepID=UPI00262DEC23|nr:ABC transporter substrate-binding protein [Enterovirga sp.]MDB5592567.1 transporter substrate-binding protein [Enterovirga sp.]